MFLDTDCLKPKGYIRCFKNLTEVKHFILVYHWNCFLLCMTWNVFHVLYCLSTCFTVACQLVFIVFGRLVYFRRFGEHFKNVTWQENLLKNWPYSIGLHQYPFLRIWCYLLESERWQLFLDQVLVHLPTVTTFSWAHST